MIELFKGKTPEEAVKAVNDSIKKTRFAINKAWLYETDKETLVIVLYQ